MALATEAPYRSSDMSSDGLPIEPNRSDEYLPSSASPSFSTHNPQGPARAIALTDGILRRPESAGKLLNNGFRFGQAPKPKFDFVGNKHKSISSTHQGEQTQPDSTPMIQAGEYLDSWPDNTLL